MAPANPRPVRVGGNEPGLNGGNRVAGRVAGVPLERIQLSCGWRTIKWSLSLERFGDARHSETAAPLYIATVCIRVDTYRVPGQAFL